MRDGVTRAIALLLATVLALAARAEVATNCFRLVTYQPGAIYHLVHILVRSTPPQ